VAAEIFGVRFTPESCRDCRRPAPALAYHFIRKAEVAPTATEVTGRVETWLANNFAVNVDFKIFNALDTLDRFGLVRREGDRLFVPPLEPAIAQLHQIWNNFFKRE